MQCPVCQNTALVMSERQGIEIDYCPQCRGVWLDRGELDKIVDRSQPAPQAQPGGGAAQAQPYQPPSRTDHVPGYAPGHYRKKKREGFLSEIFDFD